MTDYGKFLYSKLFGEKYDKPRYRITITPKVNYWEIDHIWVLKHWGKKRIEAGGYQHKFQKYGNVLYYRID